MAVMNQIYKEETGFKVQRKLKIFAYKNRVLLLQLESVQLIWKNCGIIDQKVPITKDLF